MRQVIVVLALLSASGTAEAESARPSPIWDRHQSLDCTMDTETTRQGAPLRLRFDLAKGSLCRLDEGACALTRKVSVGRAADRVVFTYENENARFFASVRSDGRLSMIVLESGRRIEDTGRCQQAAM